MSNQRDNGEWLELAKKKLDGGFNKISGQKESAMKGAVRNALLDFCRQDGEFAQAVAQGGAFADCMKAVAKNTGTSISDLEAYRKAVSFYFPGADIQMTMRINLGASVEDRPEPDGAGKSIALNLPDLSDFL